MKTSHREKLKGLFAPLATPFAADEGLDLAALGHNLALYRKTPLQGVLALGSNGENKSLSEEERVAVVDAVLAGRGPGQVVMAGVMYESQRLAEQFLGRIGRGGVDFGLVQSPSYFKKMLTDECLYRYFSTLADRSAIPLLLYQCPGFNGMTLSFELIQRLSRHPNIVGIKDSTSGCDLTCMELDCDDFSVTVGSIGKLRDFVARGCIGGTVSLADYCPHLAVELHKALRAGGADAEALNLRVTEANKRIAGRFGVAGVKAAMDLLGFRGGIPRRPLVALQPDEVESVRAALIGVGALDS
jgi:4-hydroxy-2-oxoglutarate aldolase